MLLLENSCSDAFLRKLLTEGRLEAESRCQKCLGSIMEKVKGHDQPKRRMPKTARTVLWEDGG